MPRNGREEELLAVRQLEKFTKTEFVDLVHGDKPDFTFVKGGHKYGLEVTDGSGEEFKRGYAEMQKIGARSFSPSGLNERPKESRRPTAELVEQMRQSEAEGCVYQGICWSERIARRIRKKVELHRNGEIQRFDHNWLLVYNFQGDDTGCLKKERYLDMLLGALGSDQSFREVLGVIYILSFEHCFILDKQHSLAFDRN